MTSGTTNEPNDGYILGRDSAANLRINMQHYLWNEGGYVLHPSVPTNVQNLRVADIGCGTGIWLTHASRILPASAHLDGFDVSLDAAPPQEWMPANITLHERDIFQPIPEDLIEKYDVVNIRLFLAVVFGKDIEVVVKTLLKLLKPGGWIQWGEYDLSTWHAFRTSNAPLEEEPAILQQLKYAGTLGGTKPSWTETHWPRELPQIFAKNGLVNIGADNRFLPPELLPYNLDCTIIACTELIEKVLDKMGGDHGNIMRDILQRVVAGRKEVCQNYGRLTVVGQKPVKK